MLKLENRTIAELVRERPWLRRVIIAYGLEPDSAQPLSHARQVNLPELCLHLHQVWDGPDGLRRLPPAQLLDYIVHCHHRYLRRVLPHLLVQARQLAEQDDRYLPLCRELAEFCREINPHMFREEMEVFPAIREMYSENRRPQHLPRWIQRLEQEHGQALQHFLAMRRALSESEGCPLMAGLVELDEDMRWHMYAENDLLFPNLRLSA